MDNAQQLLFGKFPRAVGVTTPDISGYELRQYIVHSAGEFDGVLERVRGERNIYASLSVYRPAKKDGKFAGNGVVADRVSFDFDSSAKADPNAEEDWSYPGIPSETADHEVINMMRDDPDIRDAVLGDLCDDVRRLAKASHEEDIPIAGVFSGFGIHLHQLYQPTMSRPGDKMGSTARRWISELTLSTADDKATGKPFRIMRVPNVERVCHHGDERISTRLYTIPLKSSELREIAPEDLIGLSDTPRPKIGSEPQSRPELKVQEDYVGPGYEQGLGQEKMRPIPEPQVDSEFAKNIVKEVCKMPCVYEHAFGRNPPNDVRVKVGIMFLIHGYTPEEATDIIAELGWSDFSRDTTLYQMRKLRDSGKGDWGCKTMQAKGLCTRADNKTDCPEYGYRGGNEPWLC